ncbi:MAG: alpha/beta hydrolase [Planctomycetes bacterium]|nr:alpha/beta hydrolase [Planctomycetota bacterium]
MKVVFSHGKESGPWGRKIKHLADLAKGRGCEVESIDYRGVESESDRVAILIAAVEGIEKDTLILVGSSMGGYVSLVGAAAVGPRGVFLMAPALYLPGYSVQSFPYRGPVRIVHGLQDTVVPYQNSQRYQRVRGGELLLIEADHRLAGSLTQVGGSFAQFLDSLL